MIGNGRSVWLAAAMLGVLAAGARGADLAIVEAKATVRETVDIVPDRSLPGIVRTVRLSDELAFAVVDLKLKATWAEEDKTLKVKTEAITLADEKGADCPMVGRLEPSGHYQRYSVAVYIRKPHDKKQHGKLHPLNIVFAAPKGARAFTLKLGDLERKLTVAEAGEALGPGDYATFKVLGAKLVEQTTGQFSMGYKKPKGTTTVRSMAGKLLAVEVEITPKRSNSTDGSHLYMNTRDLGLTFGKGGVAPCVGQIHGNFGYADNVSMNSGPNPDGTWRTLTYTIYFAVPEDAKAFALTYHQAVVAKGTVAP